MGVNGAERQTHSSGRCEISSSSTVSQFERDKSNPGSGDDFRCDNGAGGSGKGMARGLYEEPHELTGSLKTWNRADTSKPVMRRTDFMWCSTLATSRFRCRTLTGAVGSVR